jgi:hypothetical protein
LAKTGVKAKTQPLQPSENKSLNYAFSSETATPKFRLMRSFLASTDRKTIGLQKNMH